MAVRNNNIAKTDPSWLYPWKLFIRAIRIPETESVACSQASFSLVNPVQLRLWKTALTQCFGVGIGLGAALSVAAPAFSAEEIRVMYGPLETGISIDSLETFVNEGTIEPDLANYARRFNKQELAAIRKTLQSSAAIEQVALANFLYTPQGEAILHRLGEVVRTRSHPGFFALRASLILAAREEGGISPIGFLRAFPTDSLVIDADQGLRMMRELNQLTNVTSSALSLIETQYRKEISVSVRAHQNPLHSPGHTGPYFWEHSTLALSDANRDRAFDVDLHLPTTDESVPLIIISHGLGSDRTSYRYLAEHLASHGFAVASPEHPGSNASYIQALFEGAAGQISEPEEFINRSRDISFLLDELARRAEFDEVLGDRLDLESVAIIGQSFGGYTALSLGGAEINFRRLGADCPDGDARPDTLNLSLLLQCRAAILHSSDTVSSDTLNLRDERVKAIMAINPIGSTVFGQEGFSQVDVPVLMMTSSADVIAPTLFEQIFPFSWLTVQEKYLVLMRQATHFSTIGSSDNPDTAVALPDPIVGPDPQLAQNYTKSLSVAFLETHLRNDPSYQGFLSPSYVSRMSREPLQLSIVRFLSEEQITQMVKDTSLIISTIQ